MKYTKITAVALLAITITGCGQGESSSGVEDRGDGGQTVATPTKATPTKSAPSNGSASGAFSTYVNKYGDLAAAYNANSGGMTKEAWGKNHYCNAGRGEGRTAPGLSAASCGTATMPAKPGTSGIGRALALAHTPHAGRAVHWGSRIVSVNINTPWAQSAAHMWVQKGFQFRMGTGNQIVFAGFSSARNSVGWSKFDYRNGKITQCRIFINSKYLHRYDIAKTFAHEMGHCLGLGTGHNGTRGNLMAKYAGGPISASTKAMFDYLYSIKPGHPL